MIKHLFQAVLIKYIQIITPPSFLIESTASSLVFEPPLIGFTESVQRGDLSNFLPRIEMIQL